jgi:putative FmdB family regulatory protein|tara:strand:+ start:10194 stop:10541 length:348 start_codon:yes stop_codon:yes gene_type:complete
MPTYDYECRDCGHQVEEFQKFSEEPLSECPKCKKDTFRRVMLTPPQAFIKGEVKTVGQLADRNTEKMGRYELEDRRHADNMETHKKNKEANAFRKKINSMTPAQQKRYIEKGDNA